MSDEPIELGTAMGKVLRSLENADGAGGSSGRAGAPDVAAIGGVFGRWPAVVGEAMSRHVQPVRLDGDRLVVEVSEPAWATQVRLLSDQIRDRVLEVAGARIESIDVRVAGARRRR